MYIGSIPVIVRYEVWVCGRSLAGITGSSPAGGMDISLSCKCCVLSDTFFLRRADPSSRGDLPSVCVYVCVCMYVRP